MQLAPAGYGAIIKPDYGLRGMGEVGPLPGAGCEDGHRCESLPSDGV